MRTFHLGLSARKSVTLCTMSNCMSLLNLYILQKKEAFMIRVEHGTDIFCNKVMTILDSMFLDIARS